MKLKQLMLSLCLECIDIRLGVYSIYTIINNEVVYFEAGGVLLRYKDSLCRHDYDNLFDEDNKRIGTSDWLSTKEV